ncbi:hypothetical protein MRX96_034687 [Rhipicephalus microplus]|uniref:TNF receptor-associated factor 6-B-like n=1 Tax=Rhipicephalus microplus TaxID=6941 RepID=UPI0023769702
MADLIRVHRFRDIPIKGVNWQPTHFVDEVPISRLCGLCLMIPKKTVRLPCAHFLCEWCLAVNSQGGGGRCPLDDKPFEKARCASYDMPIGTAKALQVYCWNEAQGCKFEGALKDMLRHYNNDCLFRSYEGSKCGEAVPNKKVETHQVAGCSTSVPQQAQRAHRQNWSTDTSRRAESSRSEDALSATL